MLDRVDWKQGRFCGACSLHSRLDFDNRDRFELDRCAWEEDIRVFARLASEWSSREEMQDDLVFSCRGQEELRKNFAARYSGYLYVFLRGSFCQQVQELMWATSTYRHACPEDFTPLRLKRTMAFGWFSVMIPALVMVVPRGRGTSDADPRLKLWAHTR